MAITDYLFENETEEAGMHAMRVFIVRYVNFFNIFLTINIPLWWLLHPQIPAPIMMLAVAVAATATGFGFWFTKRHAESYWLRYVVTMATIGAGFTLVLTSFGSHNEATSTVVIGFASFSLVAAFGCSRIMTVLLIGGVAGGWIFTFLLPEAWIGSSDLQRQLIVEGALAYWWIATGIFGLMLARQIRHAMVNSIEKHADSERKAKEVAILQQQQQQQQQTAEKERLQLLETLANQVEIDMGEISKSVNDRVALLHDSFTDVLQAVDTTNDSATAIQSYSQHSAESVATVNRASTELNGSIEQISTQFAKSSQVGQDAANQITDVIGKMRQLSESAKEIGGIVELITDIANQTNLLALNATIEAARANEAGKGFAVVASEVKGLSGQTAKATDMIADQIGKVQNLVTESSDMSQKTNDIIAEIGVILAELGDAVDQQSTASQAIANSIEQASEAATQVAENAHQIDNAVQGIQSQVDDAKQVANLLTSDADGMRSTVEKLTTRIRQA